MSSTPLHLLSQNESAAERVAYNRWLAEQATTTPVERLGDYRRWVISAYLYIRSRLEVPGNCYEDQEHGPLSIGGPAHCDVMDLDQMIEASGDEKLARDVLDWILDSSPEQIAYYRGLSRIPKSNISERRDRIAEKLDKTRTEPSELVLT